MGGVILGYLWVHPVEFDILWLHATAEMVLNQNFDSKNTNAVSERVLKVKSSDFCMVKSERVMLG